LVREGGGERGAEEDGGEKEVDGAGGGIGREGCLVEGLRRGFGGGRAAAAARGGEVGSGNGATRGDDEMEGRTTKELTRGDRGVEAAERIDDDSSASFRTDSGFFAFIACSSCSSFFFFPARTSPLAGVSSAFE
jgi:hypothetical protein